MFTTERHPLEPFLPENTTLLMLGSFPPARKRWCMDFFYPNFTNDMWRIFGLCFHGDKFRFVDNDNKTYRRTDIEALLNELGVGIYDTATVVCRTKDTASDKDLEVIEPTDLKALLRRIPHCSAVVTTGQKATEVFSSAFSIPPPKVGEYATFVFGERPMRLYRMPSSSRAYPMKVEKKAEFYDRMFREVGLLQPAHNPFHF